MTKGPGSDTHTVSSFLELKEEFLQRGLTLQAEKGKFTLICKGASIKTFTTVSQVREYYAGFRFGMEISGNEKATQG